MIKIEDNIPIPTVNSGTRHPGTDAADSIQVGQSFVWPNPEGVSNGVLKNRIRGMLGRLAPKRFTSRVVTETVGHAASASGNEAITREVVRVWRIADAAPTVAPTVAPPIPPLAAQ